MSAITGIDDSETIAFRPSTSTSRGTATRTRSEPASATASAAFHLDKVREVYPGTTAAPNSQYVVLQMPVTGENFLSGHKMVYYNASGGQIGTSSPANVASKSQGTILFATTNPILGK